MGMIDSSASTARDFARRLRRRLRSGMFGSRCYPVSDPGRDISALVALGITGERPVVINARLDHCRWTGGTGFPYGPASPHPYVQALLQYQSAGIVSPRESRLWRYYELYRPATLADFQGIQPREEASLLDRIPPLNIYPWSGVPGETLKRIAEGSLSWPYSDWLNPSYVLVRSVGPQLPEFVEKRLAHLTKVYDAIVTEGFRTRPDPRKPYFEQFIVGDVMVRDGETRMMLANGQHRAAALSSLGHVTAPILVGVRHHRGPYVIRRDEVKDWPLVREGLYRAEQALTVFDRIFDARGPWPPSFDQAWVAPNEDSIVR
jgi:hypothetical protein